MTARSLLARLVLGMTLGSLGACGGDGYETVGRDPSGPPGGSPAGGASNGGTGGQVGTGGGPLGAGGEIVLGAGGTGSSETCQPTDGALRIFEDQEVRWGESMSPVLYSWTVPEQEDELRAGGPLLSVGESAELGRGIATDKLHAWIASEQADVVDTAVAGIFEKFRYAWPNPWATRLGFPGEDYGNRLVRIELRPDAWVARLDAFSGRVEEVHDLFGRHIPREEVELSPERIAALYYEHVGTGMEDSTVCIFGTFSEFGGSGGYREFIVGNPDMVERWSIGTEQILERLNDDIQLLRLYLEQIRPCPSTSSSNFNAIVSCQWGAHEDAYLEALALPSELYVPDAARLVSLIETLEGDKFEPDPYEADHLPEPGSQRRESEER